VKIQNFWQDVFLRPSESERSTGVCGGDWNPEGCDGGGVGMLRSIMPSALISILGYSLMKYLRASL
jgi:hypothetical protein